MKKNKQQQSSTHFTLSQFKTALIDNTCFFKEEADGLFQFFFMSETELENNPRFTPFGSKLCSYQELSKNYPFVLDHVVKTLFKLFDQNHENRVSLCQLKKGVRVFLNSDIKAKTKMEFRMYNKSHSGVLSREEFNQRLVDVIESHKILNIFRFQIDSNTKIFRTSSESSDDVWNCNAKSFVESSIKSRNVADQLNTIYQHLIDQLNDPNNLDQIFSSMFKNDSTKQTITFDDYEKLTKSSITLGDIPFLKNIFISSQ